MAIDLFSLPKRVYKTLSNLRTGIVLLILTGVAAALGTFILQRPATDPDKLAQAYSPAMLRVLDRLMLTDVFHAWWFTALLTLVSLSIIFVSVDRFPNSWRFYARPYRKTDSHFRSAVRSRVELPIANAEQGLGAAERAMKKLGWPVERIADPNEPALYSERHRFSVMAVYVIHASLLLIFLGGIIDGIWGYKGFISLERGQQSNVVHLGDMGNKEAKTLPFSLKCYSAGEETYPDGSPKRWWSKLAVIQDGQVVKTQEIAVNDPLTYKGVRFYQASFGQTGRLDGLKVQTIPEGATGTEVTLQMNQPFDLDANTTVTLAEYIPDFFIRDNQVFKRSDDPVNPAFRLMVTNKASAQEAKLWIFPAYNPNAQGEKANYGFAYRDMQMGYFTGLSVSHQPGQWGVWVGVLLMSLGLGVAFYMVHMRLWVAAIPNAQGKLVLWIGGMANKNRDRFEQKFGELVDEIRTELEQVQPKVKTKLKSTESELNLTIAH
jgi:cytochrome c biogenesis protein